MNTAKLVLKYIGLGFLNVLSIVFGKPEDVEFIQKYTQKVSVEA